MVRERSPPRSIVDGIFRREKRNGVKITEKPVAGRLPKLETGRVLSVCLAVWRDTLGMGSPTPWNGRCRHDRRGASQLEKLIHRVLDDEKQGLEFKLLGVEVGGMSAALFHQSLAAGRHGWWEHTVFSSACGLAGGRSVMQPRWTSRVNRCDGKPCLG